MIGETISHYRLLEKLGSGGMGVVYAAEDLKLGRKVALKFLSSEFSRDPVALYRFEREARAASALNHPNICTIYDIDDYDGQRFMAMELLKGATLKDWIASQPLPLDRLLDFACQIVTGLEAAHAEGIIHRDVKPANIFVTQNGFVKLLDFGLAKLSATHRGAMETAVGATMESAPISKEDLTVPGSAVGTVAYMSPEQALGEPLDVRTDLFSFGAVLYQMVTGNQPFYGNTSAGVIDGILHKYPSPVITRNPGVPRELQDIINKAMEKDREMRYQSAAELKVDLQRLRRDSQSSRSAVVSAQDPTETVTNAQLPSAPAVTPIPASTAQKKSRLPFVAAALAILVIAALAVWWRLGSRPAPATHLVIQSRPGAQVMIGGQPAGTVGADGTVALEVPPGSHPVRVTAQEYQPYSANIEVNRGESKNVVAELAPLPPPPAALPAVKPGELVISSNVAGANILVNGQLKGFTDRDKTMKLELNPGTYKVQLKKAGYDDSPEQSVDVGAQQESPLTFTLNAAQGAASTPAGTYLIVKSSPGAAISVDGMPSGTVGNNGTFPVELEPGDHVVQASLNGYQPYSSSVPVKANAKTFLVAALKPSAPVVSSFSAAQQRIMPGQTTSLSWSTQNATEVHIEPAIGSVALSGTHDVSPSSSTTYVLTAKGAGGSTTAKTRVAVEANPADVQAIEQTMARFKGAYDSMDINAIRREWPTLTSTQSDALKTTFLGLQSVRLNDDCAGSPTVEGDTAQWNCHETVAYALKGGRQIPNVQNTVIFHFKRAGGGWHIDRREGQ